MNLDAKKPNLLGRKLVQPVDGGPVLRSEMRRNSYNVPRLVFSRICDCLAEMPVIGPFELIFYNHLFVIAGFLGQNVKGERAYRRLPFKQLQVQSKGVAKAFQAISLTRA